MGACRLQATRLSDLPREKKGGRSTPRAVVGVLGLGDVGFSVLGVCRGIEGYRERCGAPASQEWKRAGSSGLVVVAARGCKGYYLVRQGQRVQASAPFHNATTFSAPSLFFDRASASADFTHNST